MKLFCFKKKAQKIGFYAPGRSLLGFENPWQVNLHVLNILHAFKLGQDQTHNDRERGESNPRPWVWQTHALTICATSSGNFFCGKIMEEKNVRKNGKSRNRTNNPIREPTFQIGAITILPSFLWTSPDSAHKNLLYTRYIDSWANCSIVKNNERLRRKLLRLRNPVLFWRRPDLYFFLRTLFYWDYTRAGTALDYKGNTFILYAEFITTKRVVLKRFFFLFLFLLFLRNTLF